MSSRAIRAAINTTTAAILLAAIAAQGVAVPPLDPPDWIPDPQANGEQDARAQGLSATWLDCNAIRLHPEYLEAIHLRDVFNIVVELDPLPGRGAEFYTALAAADVLDEKLYGIASDVDVYLGAIDFESRNAGAYVFADDALTEGDWIEASEVELAVGSYEDAAEFWGQRDDHGYVYGFALLNLRNLLGICSVEAGYPYDFFIGPGFEDTLIP